MADEIGIATSFQDAMEVGFKNTWRGHLRSIWNAIVPVQSVGHRLFSNVERPSWGLCVQVPWNAVAGYACAGITSRLDIAIEGLSFNVFSAAGVPVSSTVTCFTPPAAYNPWLVDVLTWSPWIRPTLRFSSSNTLGISGRNNVGVSPYVGWQFYSDLSTGNYARHRWINFDPPIILPATMFLALQNPAAVNYTMTVNFRYREIG